MTIEEFKSRYFYKELKCKRCGEMFKRYFRKNNTPQSVIDMYTREGAPVFCDECWENHNLEELLCSWENEDGAN